MWAGICSPPCCCSVLAGMHTPALLYVGRDLQPSLLLLLALLCIDRAAHARLAVCGQGSAARLAAVAVTGARWHGCTRPPCCMWAGVCSPSFHISVMTRQGPQAASIIRLLDQAGLSARLDKAGPTSPPRVVVIITAFITRQGF